MRTGLLSTMALPILAIAALLMPPAALADELAGTWRGEMTRGDESFPVEFNFSGDGFFVTSYTNNTGVTRNVELSEPGQQIQYVPDGGGVMTVEVMSVDKRSNGLALVLSTTFERASGGYLDQQYIEEALTFLPTAAGLEVRLESRSNSRFGDQDMSVGGGGDVSVAEGVLQRVE